MKYVKVAQRNEVNEGEMIRVTAEEQDILLLNVEGHLYALPNKCPHKGGNLLDGKLEGHFLTCPKHGTRFDVRTGMEVADAKGFLGTVKVENLLPYAVRMENDGILVEVDAQ